MTSKSQPGMANSRAQDTGQDVCLGRDSLLDFLFDLPLWKAMIFFLKTKTLENVLKFCLKHFIVFK